MMYKRKKTSAGNKTYDNELCSKQLSLPFNTVCCQNTCNAAGYYNGTTLNNAGSNGNYWSSTENNSSNSYELNFNSDNHNINNNNRYNGQSVRPVRELINQSHKTSINIYRITKEQLLTDLLKAYKDARRHKRRKNSQLEFEIDMERCLVELRDELWNRTYKPGCSVCFIIKEPKKREIFAAEFKDRVVHHLYYNYTIGLYESVFIEDSYSCRKGKGTHYGIRRMVKHIRSCSDNYKHKCYVLKCDIQGYFMNIDRNRLLSISNETLDKMAYHLIRNKDKCWIETIDYDLIKYLNKIIILNNPLDNCLLRGNTNDWIDLPSSKSLFNTAKHCGLPIGNLTSQLFSNVYMNILDQYVKRDCKQKYYGRYVDDIYVVNRSKQNLNNIKIKIEYFLKNNLGLLIHPNKTYIVDSNYGIEFLGGFIKPYREYVKNQTKKRIINKIQMLEISDIKNLESVINSYIGILGHYKSYKLRRKLFNNSNKFGNIGRFNQAITKFSINMKITD